MIRIPPLKICQTAVACWVHPIILGHDIPFFCVSPDFGVPSRAPRFSMERSRIGFRKPADGNAAHPGESSRIGPRTVAKLLNAYRVLTCLIEIVELSAHS